MRPPEVQAADIVAAGEKLLSEGKRLSGWTLRRALGDRGKAARLFAVWQDHLETQLPAATQEQALSLSLPPQTQLLLSEKTADLTGFIEGIAGQLHREIESLFSHRYAHEFEALRAAEATYEADLQTAEDSLLATEEHNTSLQATVDAQTDLLAQAQNEAGTLSERVRTLDHDRQTALNACEEAGHQIVRLTGEAARLKEAHAAANARAQAITEEAAHVRRDLDQEREASGQLSQRLDEALAATTDLQTQLARKEEQARALEQRAADAMQRADSEASRAAGFAERLAVCDDRLAQMRSVEDLRNAKASVSIEADNPGHGAGPSPARE